MVITWPRNDVTVISIKAVYGPFAVSKEQPTNGWLRLNEYQIQRYLQWTCTYTNQKSIATLGGEMVDPEITVKLEMQDVL